MAILILTVVVAVCFDFTNGFHDTANAVATSIATGALKPRYAVVMSGVFNLVGAFVSIQVAKTIASGVVQSHLLAHGHDALVLVFAALVGAVIWNLITWYLTLPSSSSHALIGGLIGAAVFSAGSHAVQWHTVIEKVIAPAVLSPIICALVAGVSTFVVYKMIRSIGEAPAKRGYKLGQIGSAALVSLAHGTNDAQKTMGVITLALIANGSIHAVPFFVPLWVKIICAVAISSGTMVGGWRIINTLGNRITNVESPMGFAAETASAAVILSSSYYGYPLSTTHVVSGGVMGAGLGKKLAGVHWDVFGQMLTGWVVTIPAAGLVGGVAWEVSRLFGRDSSVGSYVMAVIAALAALGLVALAQRSKIGAKDLDRTGGALEPALSPAVPAPVAAGAIGGGN